MNPEGRRQVETRGPTPMSSSPPNYTYLTGKWVVGRNRPARSDPAPAEGVAALREELLDRRGVEGAQLVVGETVSHSMQGRNPDLPPNLAAAFNDYVLDPAAVQPRLRDTPASPPSA